MRSLVSFTLAAATLAFANSAEAGTWRYRMDSNDGHILQYQDNGQAVFELSCGRGFTLLAKHPTETKTDGNASITISSAGGKMTIKGDFVPPYAGALNVAQAYLGYSKRDPAVYGEKWQKLESNLLDVLAVNGPITISAGKASYQLPPIDIDKWREPFNLCGFGYWVTPQDFPAERW